MDARDKVWRLSFKVLLSLTIPYSLT
jgi:hypothetical protein